MAVQLLRAADRPASPWKNGGGVTRQIAIFPLDATLATFDWRVSEATVHTSGPFSRFENVDRILAVVAGGAIRLSIDGRKVTLDRYSAPIAFPADRPVHAQLLGASLTDLNVMVRRRRFQARVLSMIIGAPTPIAASLGQVLVFAVGPVKIDTDTVLQAGDAVLVEPNTTVVVGPHLRESRLLIVNIDRI